MRSGGGARPRSRSPGSSGSSSSRSAGSSDGIGTAKPGGRRLSSRPEPFSSSRPGRSPSCLQAEMRQEVLGGAVGDRPARRLAAAARPDPAGLHQHVERALRHRHAADFLDLGAGHRLVIGDDGERLDRGARQLLRDHRFLASSSHDRSSAVRNVHLLPMRTRLTPRGAYSACSARRLRLEIDVLRQPRAKRLLVERHRRRQTAAPRAAADAPGAPRRRPRPTSPRLAP